MGIRPNPRLSPRYNQISRWSYPFTLEHREAKGQAGYSRVELVLARPRLYMIRAGHIKRAKLDAPEMKAFFGSFQLTP